MLQATLQLQGIGAVGRVVAAGDFHVQRSRGTKIEDLGADVGRHKGKLAAGETLGQGFTQAFDVVRGRAVVGLEGDLNIAILRADGAAAAVGHVDAAQRNPDVVDDGVQLLGRDDFTNARLDPVEGRGAFFNARAQRQAHMQRQSPGVGGRKEVLAQARQQHERGQHAGHEAQQKTLAMGQGQFQHAVISIAHGRETPLEPLLETQQCPHRCRMLWGVPVALVMVDVAIFRVMAWALLRYMGLEQEHRQGWHQGARQNEGGAHGENH